LILTIVERIEGHYDVQEVEFGRVYRWCPERFIVECGCGQRTSLTASSTATCRRCGIDLAVIFREEPTTERSSDEIVHPWRYAEHREGDGLPC
jgi:hypothetical protein